MKKIVFLLPIMLIINHSSDCKIITKNIIGWHTHCSGNTYCSSCSNCNYRSHCNPGGSCRICGSYTTPLKTATEKYKITHSYTVSRLSATATEYNISDPYVYDDVLTVISKSLNLRSSPNTGCPIIEKLKMWDMVTFISYEGEWLKVKVIESGKIGYVNRKFVR